MTSFSNSLNKTHQVLHTLQSKTDFSSLSPPPWFYSSWTPLPHRLRKTSLTLGPHPDYFYISGNLPFQSHLFFFGRSRNQLSTHPWTVTTGDRIRVTKMERFAKNKTPSHLRDHQHKDQGSGWGLFQSALSRSLVLLQHLGIQRQTSP